MHSSPQKRERVLWSGIPSHSLYLWTHLLSFLSIFVITASLTSLSNSFPEINFTFAFVFGILIPFSIMFWKWSIVLSTFYELTTERIRCRRGVFNKTTEEVELYRIRDYEMIEPFFLRLFNAGHIILINVDATSPKFLLQAIPYPEPLREEIRHQVEKTRETKNIRLVDI